MGPSTLGLLRQIGGMGWNSQGLGGASVQGLGHARSPTIAPKNRGDAPMQFETPPRLSNRILSHRRCILVRSHSVPFHSDLQSP